MHSVGIDKKVIPIFKFYIYPTQPFKLEMPYSLRQKLIYHHPSFVAFFLRSFTFPLKTFGFQTKIQVNIPIAALLSPLGKVLWVG